MIDVVSMGEILIDFAEISHNPDGYPTLSGNPGGAPANFLAPLAKFGKKTAMLGKVGDDAFGRLLINTFKSNGIDAEGIKVDSNNFTTLAFVTLDNEGNRSFSFSRKPGADTQLSFEEVNLSFIDECKVFHFGSLSLTLEPSRTCTKKLVEYAKKKGKLISYDPNLRIPLWNDLEEAKKEMIYGLEQANIVKISDEEVEFLFHVKDEDACEFLLKKYPNIQLLYVTCGKKGCYYSNRKVRGFSEAMKSIKVIDTTGAGDIFGGSAMYKLLETKKKPEELNDKELQEIVRFATTSAGLSTTKLGGISSVPTLDEVNKTL